VGARCRQVTLAHERNRGVDRLPQDPTRRCVELEPGRHVEHGEPLGLRERLRERVAVVAVPRGLEAAVELRVVAVHDRARLDVERLAGGDLHRHDLLVQDRADLRVRSIGRERAHLGHADGRGDDQCERESAEGSGETNRERKIANAHGGFLLGTRRRLHQGHRQPISPLYCRLAA
jgi:hypothetical protein